MSYLKIDCDWIEPTDAIAEVAVTSALVKIQCGHDVLTRAKNDFSKSVMDHVVLSAYPLALWFAESWWRLRWETAPTSAASMSWRMAHEMPAAGFGFVWPCMSFEAADDVVRVVAKASVNTAFEPVQYLTRGEYWLSAHNFELSVRQFVELVCERLVEFGIRTSTLQALWGEVKTETENDALSQVRRIEAMLGFDAGRAPDRLVDAFDRIVSFTGKTARDEVAYAVAGIANQEDSLSMLITVGEQASITGKLETLDLIDVPQVQLPWQRGYAFAKKARELVCQSSGPLSNKLLGDLLGLRGYVVAEGEAFRGSKAGLAVREAGRDRFAFRKAYGPRRRFEAARLIADHLVAPKEERWLVETDSRSSRQQIQRAFAAEFLSPIEALVEFLGGDYSEEKIEDAADYFDVEEITVRQQLINFRPEGMPYIQAY